MLRFYKVYLDFRKKFKGEFFWDFKQNLNLSFLKVMWTVMGTFITKAS